MPLINCEINLQLKWSKNGILVAGTAANQNPSFQVNYTKLSKLYVPVVTLSTLSRKSQSISSSNCGNKRL